MLCYGRHIEKWRPFLTFQIEISSHFGLSLRCLKVINTIQSINHLTHSVTFIIPVINVVSIISITLDQDSFDIAFSTVSTVDENTILHTTWWPYDFNVAITRKVLIFYKKCA